jgi:hypothetical protein
MVSLRTLAGWLPIALALAQGTALAQVDPPGRVGSLSAVHGSVVLAPAGETAWSDAALNRPVTAGDRLWTDSGGRAEVHLGAALLHVDGESFLDVKLLDDAVLQALLHEGVVQAHVRALAPGEPFEIDTPQLALRALQPGTYRIDADPQRHITRVAVRDGLATVAGRSGHTLTLYPGQQLEVAGADLEQLASVSFAEDDFDAWAAERNASKDRSLAARFLPAAVVGASQLDSFGAWAQDPALGTVWYPRGVAADWAPYRYGRWQWIRPWGWTWIDDAPWGFAPFHYGRWTRVGARWAWVPGRLGAHPLYAPALVAFVGDVATGASALAGSERIGWYPVGPGEPWRPFFAASERFMRRANGSASETRISVEHAPDAVTTLRIDEFRSGQPVQRFRQRSNAVVPHPQTTAPRQQKGPQRELRPWSEQEDGSGRQGHIS